FLSDWQIRYFPHFPADLCFHHYSDTFHWNGPDHRKNQTVFHSCHTDCHLAKHVHDHKWFDLHHPQFRHQGSNSDSALVPRRDEHFQILLHSHVLYNDLSLDELLNAHEEYQPHKLHKFHTFPLQ